MKDSEKIFFTLCYRLNDKVSVWQIAEALESIIPMKRMKYYVSKWEELGFYDCGVNEMFGWFYPDVLPERYKNLVEE